MIYADVNLTIKENESVCDSTIVLYRGDKNVQIRFNLKDNRFTVIENTYAQMIIKRPSATSLFSEVSKIENNTVILTISEEMIDEIKEIGTYQFQIRLYDDNLVARATLPPCNNCLIIERPIAIEEESIVNYSRINDAVIMAAEYSEEDIFDDNNDYIKTEWVDGDIISDVRMNKIENALYSINEKASVSNDVDLSGYVTDEELEAKGYLTNVPEEVQTEIDNIKIDMSNMENDIDTILSIIDEPPTYTKPSISIALSKTSLEHSKSYDISITTTFKQNDAGNVTGYKVYKNNSVIFENTSVSSYTDTISIQHGGSITYKTEVTYGDGPIKNTMLGIPYPSTAIKSGSVTSSGTIKAYALSYYGVIDGSEFVDVSGLTSKLRTTKSDTITMSLTNQRIIYMYPKSFGNLTSIKDANNFDYINSYTLSNTVVNDVEYNIYILTDPVTITNFKQIFN